MSGDCWQISMPGYTGMLSAWTGKKGALQLPMREVRYTFYSLWLRQEWVLESRLSFQILAPTLSMLVTVPKELKSNSRFNRNRGLKAMLVKSPFLAFCGIFVLDSSEFKRGTKKQWETYGELLILPYYQRCSGYRQSHGQMGSVCIIPLSWLSSTAEVEEHVVSHTAQGIPPRVHKVLWEQNTHSRIV